MFAKTLAKTTFNFTCILSKHDDDNREKNLKSLLLEQNQNVKIYQKLFKNSHKKVILFTKVVLLVTSQQSNGNIINLIC